MSSNHFPHTGYRWRDELVNNLLPYVREGVDRQILNNVVRPYVPVFFPIEITESTGATWLSVRPLFNEWWKTELEAIGRDLAHTPFLNDKTAKNIFENHQWETEMQVEGISVENRSARWKFDAYKNRVGVEVELSSRSQVFKDAFKFLIGQAMSQIDVGVVMVRRELVEQRPHFGSVRRDWHAMYTTLPMLNIAFHGF